MFLYSHFLIRFLFRIKRKIRRPYCINKKQFIVCKVLVILCAVYILHKFSVNLQNLAFLFFTWVMLILAFIDIEHLILPDEIIIPLIWLGLIFNAFSLFVSAQDAILGASLGYLSLWSITYVFKLCRNIIGMGHGDFKLFATLGAWFGWKPLPLILLFASITGSLWGFFIFFWKKHKVNEPFPFGPFLAISGLIVVIITKNFHNF